MPETVLDIADLRVRFGGTEAVRGASLTVARGETHCLVGESGCGKSVTSLAIMGLLARGAVRSAGHMRFQGQDIAGLGNRAMNRLRGDRLSMIFQEPMTSLNPAYTIGSQMTEVYRRHRGGSQRHALDHAAVLLSKVGMANPAMRLGQFPHQLSGGLRQRVMIAMALMCSPALILADEPTTALDVTIQAQILHLLAELQRELAMGLVLITHDLGIVARIATRVIVMYAGQVVESGPAEAIFRIPAHPYTRGLLACIPVPGRTARGGKLGTIPGLVPSLIGKTRGCAFASRCEYAIAKCRAVEVPLEPSGSGCAVRCLRHAEIGPPAGQGLAEVPP